jgi:hypothetical protein
MLSGLFSSSKASSRKCNDVSPSTSSKRHRGGSSSSSAISPAREQPARSPSVEEDEEYEVNGSKVDGDDENEPCTQVALVEIIFVEHEERVNEYTKVRTKVDWYKVALDSAVNYICVDPIDGVKVWGGNSAEETEANAYDIALLT